MTDSLGDGRSLAPPRFPDDDGSAPEVLGHRLDALRVQSNPRTVMAARMALVNSRLLVPVVAVLDSEEDSAPDREGQSGLRREKDSHMASVSIRLNDGRLALLAFTSVAAMAHWDLQARPVAALAEEVAGSAVAAGADLLLLDIAGPVTLEVPGRHLDALAHATVVPPPWLDPSVQSAVVEAVGIEFLQSGAVAVRLAKPGPENLELALVVEVRGDAQGVSEVAQRLGQSITLGNLLEGGLAVAHVG